MKKIKNWWNEYYPSVLSIILTLLLGFFIWANNLNISDFNEVKSVFEGTLTFTSIILGFIGVLITFVVSLKSESERVLYFFDHIDQSFFVRIVKYQILSGLLLSVLSISMFIIVNYEFANIVFIFWFYPLIYFSCSTYRLLSCLIDLMLRSDPKKPKVSNPIKK